MEKAQPKQSGPNWNERLLWWRPQLLLITPGRESVLILSSLVQRQPPLPFPTSAPGCASWPWSSLPASPALGPG